jgi:cytoskeletal protein CcmA (bactofilin family)
MSSHPLPQLMQMWRHWRLWFLSVFSAALLAACGGGELVGGVGSGGTGAYGAINGFGSIIVNGVRYKDDTATVYDDSGNGATLTQSDLKLGMVVEISGDDVVAGVNGALPTSNAGQVYVRSEIKGPVEAISGTTLTVLGQTVNTTASTVYDALTLPGGFSDMVAGSTLVEIYGYADGQGTIVATRIEKEDSTSAYKLRGTVSVLDTTAKTFRIGNAVINYATATEPLPSLSEGMTVRVELNTTPTAGVWAATKVKATRTFDSLTTDGFKAEIEGSITSYTSDQSFSVNGIAVNAANAASIPAGLGLGSVVEVEGTLTNGTLIATQVELEDDDALDNREYELHGRIDALDTVAQTLQIRGVTVQYTSTTQFESGSSATNLSAGVAVEIKGTLNSTGTLLIAERIEFEDLDDERSESGYELKGTISALNTTAKTFVVRGVTVDYSSTSLTVDDGALADLADGALVEVHGTPNSSNDRLIATEIDFEDSSEMEIDGEISAVDGSSFTLNGITYTYDVNTTVFRDGTKDNLAVGATVDIRVIDNGGTYTVTRITFED